jgi:hypothetical protein
VSRGTVSITGTPRNNLTLSLSKGWNLIGGISTEIGLNEITQTPPNSFDLLYYWNAEQRKWENPLSLLSLQPGKAYWIYAKNDCRLTMSKSSASAKISDVALSIEEAFKKLRGLGTIEIRDHQSNSTRLYFSEYSELLGALDKYLLPPLGPKGTFDVRFTNDRFVSILEDGETDHHIRIQSVNYPILLTWAGLDTTKSEYVLTNIFDGKILGYNTMSSRGSLTIADPRVESVVIRTILLQETKIPTRYFLGQNYPNPFNPETKIDFTVADATLVQITIYDVLGREVKRLVDRAMQPGHYNIHWEGRSEDGKVVSSGIYFYKMTAAGFAQVRKMMFVR